MATMTLSTIGVYNYDPTLFDGLDFPVGIDKDIAVSQILTRSGEFEVLYPNPTFYKQMITFWGKKHYRTFEKWVEGLSIPFDPLYNYDRFEEYVTEKTGVDSRTGSSIMAGTSDRTGASNASTSSDVSGMNKDSSSLASSQNEKKTTQGTAGEVSQEITENTSDATTGTTGARVKALNENVSNNSTNETQVSAFDSATYSPKENQILNSGQTTNSGETDSSETSSTSSGSSDTSTGRTNTRAESGTESAQNDQTQVSSGTGEHSETGTTSESRQDVQSQKNAESREDKESGTRAESEKHTAHLYGNIGVTTSAQLLREFLDVERFNIYEQIADLFVDEFCIMVY